MAEPTPIDRLEFAGSEICDMVWQDDGALHVTLSAAAVQRHHGQQVTHGYLRPVLLRLEQAEVDGPLAEALGAISAGRLQDEATGAWCALVGVPSLVAGPLHLELHCAHGSVLSIRAQALEVRVPGAAQFFENYAC
jgi:hypothetical protein